MPFAVTVTTAMPCALVVAEFAERPALAPLAGALKATDLPLTGVPTSSTTSTEICCANCFVVAADCGEPENAYRLLATLAVTAANVAVTFMLDPVMVKVQIGMVPHARAAPVQPTNLFPAVGSATNCTL